MIEEAFEKTYKARIMILDDIMLKAIPEYRSNLSKYAPKITSMQVAVDKIKDVIGSGGKTINKIIEETGVKIDIEEDGTVFVAGTESIKVDKALEIISNIVKELEVGEIYNGKVTKTIACGAIVEVLPGKEGLLHISKISKQRVEKVEDVLKIGDSIEVKVTDIDRDSGKFSLVSTALFKKD